MDDDWTIVRSPFVENEVESLSPSPRQFLKGIGIGVSQKAAGCHGDKAKAKAIDVIPNMSKMDNVSSEDVDEKSRDAPNNAPLKENEENVIEEIASTWRRTGARHGYLYVYERVAPQC